MVPELHKCKAHIHEDGTMRLEHGLTAALKDIFRCFNLSDADIERYLHSLEWGKIPGMIYSKVEENQNRKTDAERKTSKKDAASKNQTQSRF